MLDVAICIVDDNIVFQHDSARVLVFNTVQHWNFLGTQCICTAD